MNCDGAKTCGKTYCDNYDEAPECFERESSEPAKKAQQICQERFRSVIELLQATTMSPVKADELAFELKERIKQDVTLDKEILCVRCLKMVELNDAYRFEKGAINAWPVHGECLDELNRIVG